MKNFKTILIVVVAFIGGMWTVSLLKGSRGPLTNEIHAGESKNKLPVT